MAKANNVEKLQAEIAEARAAKEHQAQIATAAADRYAQAVKAGDMDAAKRERAAQDDAQASVATWTDRIAALEASHTEAERADNGPALRKAVKTAQEAVAQERAVHDEVSALIAQAEELRTRLREAHSTTSRAYSQMIQAAQRAHESPPKLERDHLDRRGTERLRTVAREIAGIGSFQSNQIFQLSERLRKGHAA